MKESKALKTCVIAEWVLVILSIILSIKLESHLPETLQNWLIEENEREVQLHELIAVLCGLPMLAMALAGSVGLFLLKRWGAYLYLFASIFGYLLYPAFGPTVEHVLAEVVDEFAIMLNGVILWLAFFTDTLKVKSAPENNSSRPPPLNI